MQSCPLYSSQPDSVRLQAQPLRKYPIHQATNANEGLVTISAAALLAARRALPFIEAQGAVIQQVAYSNIISITQQYNRFLPQGTAFQRSAEAALQALLVDLDWGSFSK